MKQVRLRRVAEAELEAARAWYDEQRPGLGAEFVAEVDRVLEAIGTRPASFPRVHRAVRRALLRRFPYAVFFVESGDAEIVVLAVLHQASDPARWRTRTP